MRIHPLTPRVENGELCVSARIEPEKPPYDLPEIVWFKFPEAYAHLVSEHHDGLVVALLATALCRGENIHVHSTMSAALMYGLQECLYVQPLRKPWLYKPIEVRADGTTRRTAQGLRTASTFSGGVDSTYTVWSHLAQNEQFAGNALDCAIFVQGFDIPLEHTESFEYSRAAYFALMAEWGIELVTVRTNVRQFDRWNNWISAVTFASIGLGHLLDRGVSRYYVPANDCYDDYPKGAVATLADLPLASESLQIIEDGARVSRYQKISALAQVPATYNHLRVCWNKPMGVQNCCRCWKCVATMTALDLCGGLENYSTFPLPLTRRWRSISGISGVARGDYWEFLHRAAAQGRYDFAVDMGVKLFLNYWREVGERIEKRVRQ